MPKPREQYVVATESGVFRQPGTRRPGLLGGRLGREASRAAGRCCSSPHQRDLCWWGLRLPFTSPFRTKELGTATTLAGGAEAASMNAHRSKEPLIQGRPAASGDSLLLGGSNAVLEARAKGRAREEEQMGEGETRSIKLTDVILCSLERRKLNHIPTLAQGMAAIGGVARSLQPRNGNGAGGKGKEGYAISMLAWESFTAHCPKMPGVKSPSPNASSDRPTNPIPQSSRFVSQVRANEASNPTTQPPFCRTLLFKKGPMPRARTGSKDP